MVRRLAVVMGSFEVKGRGLVLLPGIIPEGDEVFRAGQPISLRTPGGSSIATRIAALGLLYPNPKGEVMILLQGFAQGDIPAGTEVWSSESAETGPAKWNEDRHLSSQG
jgi:hypothetical protein